MTFEVKAPIAILSIFAILGLGSSTPITTSDPQFQSSLDSFSKNIFSELYRTNGKESLIFSPFSIQTCLAMVRMGADGQTAIELDQGLSFSGQSAESIANNYHTMLANYENSKILQIANKVYAMEGYKLQDTYNDILSEKFFSPAENINFGESEKAADEINAWVESKTNNTIKELVKADMLSSDTRLFLLSAIHFQGSWKRPFDVKNTRERDFYIDDTNSVKVQMMYKVANGFGRLSDLDATAVILPYLDTDLSMMIILPNARNGLAALEAKLKNAQLKSLREQIVHMQLANISLPKFKAEFKIELRDVLKKMGMKKMFSNADFSQMLKPSESLFVDTVIHKAFIEVSEVGTEASAATGVGISFKSGPAEFNANHPFYYVILNEDSVPLFQGTFVGI